MLVRCLCVALAALSVPCISPPTDLHAGSPFSPNIGMPPSTPALVRTLLNSVSWRRRAEAADLLGNTGDARVLEALATAAAHDTSPEVRRAARQSIRRIRGDNNGFAQGGPGFLGPQVGQNPNVALVDSWYQRFLGRSADRAGLVAHVDLLQRGVPPEDVQANILGSDEFWQRNGSSPVGFIAGLYSAVLGRRANRDEIGGWGRRFNLVRGDRNQLARAFVIAAQQELLQRQQNDPIIPF